MSTNQPTGPAKTGTPPPLDSKLKEGLIHHQNGRLAEAEAVYRHILQTNPNHSVALCMLGIIAQATNNNEQAIALISKSIEINPNFADAHCNLGAVFSSENRLQDALKCFERALELKPDYLNASTNKSLILQKLGEFDAALRGFQYAHTLSPQSPEILFHIADLQRLLLKYDAALLNCNAALKINPNFVSALELKGTLIQAGGKTSEAISIFDTALKLNDQIASLHINKGNCLVILEQYDEAIECLNLALSLQPGNAAAHSNKGVLLRLIGKPQEAEQNFRDAIKIEPNYAEAHQNLGLALLDQGHTEDAYEEYEWRWRIPNTAFKMRDYAAPLWDGTLDLAEKTLLLWPEQGPQDVTIWASHIKEIVSRAKQVIINTYPKLVPLYQRSFPTALVRPDATPYDKTQNDFDLHLPMGSLFKHLRPDLKSQNQDAYLIPDSDRTTYWRQRLVEIGPGPYVGISWKGALITEARSPNYTEVEDWSGLIRKKATFVNLQCGKSAVEIGEFEHQHGVKIHDFGDLDLYDNLDDVAAFAAALDLAISVSTAVSAITAGVGTPTWIISWETSPWNNIILRSRGPQLTYYNRKTGQSWEHVFTSMADQLQVLINDK